MKKYALLSSILFVVATSTFAQIVPRVLDAKNVKRCATMELMEEAIRKDPTLPAKWKVEGEKQYQAYLQRKENRKETGTQAGEIIIPVVFHLVDVDSAQAWITDRDIYEQVEILNQAYGGLKADKYQKVIPPEIYNRVGRASIKFVLARRSPSGALTSGIERRVNKTPDHISVKSFATGGLDAWDDTKYLNVWAGTFSNDEEGLLGVATFPFTTGEGPQGVVVGIVTLPYTSNVSRTYSPAYAEGGTLVHEIGHYFYLYHTFGDEYFCNNNDFRTEPGWNLPNGAGPEGDDTPEEKADSVDNAHFGNPSQNYSDGCATPSFGEMYGSFMNYFDDRALFMFSNGMRKRVEGCIDLYRPGLKTSNGATAPVAVTDAFLVTVSPRGIPERREFILNNTSLTATVRNSGTTLLNSVTLNIKMDGGTTKSTVFPISLNAGRDTVLQLGVINGTAGTHTFTISTSAPNNGTDGFTNNDTLLSFVYITSGTIAAPFTETFTNATFPPAGWQVWNPNVNTTWERSATSGFNAAGAATVQNFDYEGGGQLDDLISPAIDLGSADSALLTFRVAYGTYSTKDVSVWDGLEVYVSNNGGVSYQLAYKKTGDFLKSVSAAQTSEFTALPSSPEKWRKDAINLTPFIIPGNKLLVKFRNINAWGNNLYLDDIGVSLFAFTERDAFPISLLNAPDFSCGGNLTPSVLFGSNGLQTLKTLKINYQVDNGTANSISWTGSLNRGNVDTIALNTITGLAPGTHIITVYTSNPDGLTDGNVSNDTIRKTFYVFGTASMPITEGFESTTFPPTTWAIDNPDNGITWERTTTAASSGSGSMVIRNFDYNSVRTTDRFISSVVTGNPDYDSVFVSFDYSYAPGAHPASNGLDTLEIQVSTDCGATLTTVWKKWGPDLQTNSVPNNPATKFVPLAADWKNMNLLLSPIVSNNNFQVYFVAKSNDQNNLYIDNINIYGKIVPPRLKRQGYLVYPSPFREQFIIRNYEDPTTFQSAAVYNALGQLVWSKEFNGTAYREVYVDLGKLPAGVYTVKLNYTDKTVAERIVKL
ncbi:MAG TPA: T9SS type A sorting domain-containing protein [Hanamia sp.]